MARGPKRTGFWAGLTNELGTSLRSGVRSLGTAKGLLAVVPLLVSLFVLVRTSVHVDPISILMPNPIQVRTSGELEDGKYSPVEPIFLLVNNRGSSTAYLSSVLFNIVAAQSGGKFDDYCRYTYPLAADETRIMPPVATRIKLLESNGTLPDEAPLAIAPTNIVGIKLEYLSRAERDAMKWSYAGELDVLDNRESSLTDGGTGRDYAICFSGRLVTAAGTSSPVYWSGSSAEGTLTKGTFAKGDAVPSVAFLWSSALRSGVVVAAPWWFSL